MSQPWGLTGPQFLVIYGVGVAVAFAVPFLLRRLVRFVSSADADRQLDPYEVGYLAGGSTRVAQVVIADFVTSGAVRVDSSGRLSAADRAALGRQSAFLGDGVTCGATPFPELWLPAGVSVHQFQGKLAKLPAMAAVKARLREEGLMVPAALGAMAWIASLTLWTALFVTGCLRLAEGARNHRPIDDLKNLLVWTIFACAASLILNRSLLTNLTTFRGSELLSQPRSTQWSHEVEPAPRSRRRRQRSQRRRSRRPRRRGAALLSPGPAGNGFRFGAETKSAALFGVALLGFTAIADESTRSALLAGLPIGSGGTSCGGGGGGGCGGGGCGGGCGG